MTLDSEAQKLIDASIAKLKIPIDLTARVKQLEGEDTIQNKAIASLISRVTALEGVPVPPPTPVPVPPPPPPPTPGPGLPNVDPAYGKLLRKIFADGTLTPFKVLDYPDDHIGGGGQYMTIYNRFRHARRPAVHDGFLDLLALRRADGLWESDLVGTSQADNGPTFGLGILRVWARFTVAHATWPTAWLYDTSTWSADEIDWPEMLEGLSLTAHVIGQGAGGKYGIPLPANPAGIFHCYKTERRAGWIEFSIDEVPVYRLTAPQSQRKLAILLDSKVGHPWSSSSLPDASTPSPSVLQVAAVTYDP